MSKLRLLGKNALVSRVTSLDPFRRLPLRSFSTEGEQQESPIDPFLRSTEGLVFGKLSGTLRNTLKTDVIHFLEGCNLSTADVKVEYNRGYFPVGMMLQFPSRSFFDTAVRQTIRKGRLYKLDKVNRSQWDLVTSYDGKAVLLVGIPRNAVQEDIERFLSGCNFDPNFQFFLRPGPVESIRCAIVQFPTHIDAMNAFLAKNRDFCLNDPVTIKVLQ